jgi:hypothetical protein
MEQRATIKRMERVNLRRLPDAWGPDEEALLGAVDDATATPVQIVYALSMEWFEGVLRVLDDLEAMIDRQPSIALVLLEHLAIRLNQASVDVDDSGGGMVDAIGRLAMLHAHAAAVAGEDPIALARRLIELNTLDIVPFFDVERTHGEVLGPEGLRGFHP